MNVELGSEFTEEGYDSGLSFLPGPRLLLQSGSPAPVTGEASESVSALRNRLALALGVPAESVKLIVGEELLRDEQTLQDVSESTVQVLVSHHMQLPEMLSPGDTELMLYDDHVRSFSQVAFAIDQITEQELNEIYAGVISPLNVAEGNRSWECAAECAYLRYGGRTLGLDLFYLFVRGFQYIQWKGFVMLAPACAGVLSATLVKIVSATRLTSDDDYDDGVFDRPLVSPSTEVLSELRCVQVSVDRDFFRRSFMPPETNNVPVAKVDLSGHVAKNLWEAACQGKLHGMQGVSTAIALLMIQRQDLFSERAIIPEVCRSDEGHGPIMKQLCRILLNRNNHRGSGFVSTFGEIPLNVVDPTYEVRCNGEWLADDRCAAGAADFAVCIAFTCCMDFGGAYWSMGSVHKALFHIRLEVLGPKEFQLTSSLIASVEDGGRPMS